MTIGVGVGVGSASASPAVGMLTSSRYSPGNAVGLAGGHTPEGVKEPGVSEGIGAADAAYPDLAPVRVHLDTQTPVDRALEHQIMASGRAPGRANEGSTQPVIVTSMSRELFMEPLTVLALPKEPPWIRLTVPPGQGSLMSCSRLRGGPGTATSRPTSVAERWEKGTTISRRGSSRAP